MKTASKLNTKILIKNILDNHVWVEKIKRNFLLSKKGRGSTRFIFHFQFFEYLFARNGLGSRLDT